MSRLWEDWFCRLEALPANAVEWTVAEDFLERGRRLLEQRRLELEAPLSKSLLDLAATGAKELKYFGIEAAVHWVPEMFPQTSWSEARSLLDQLVNGILLHRATDEAKPETVVETRIWWARLEEIATRTLGLAEKLKSMVSPTSKSAETQPQSVTAITEMTQQAYLPTDAPQVVEGESPPLHNAGTPNNLREAITEPAAESPQPAGVASVENTLVSVGEPKELPPRMAKVLKERLENRGSVLEEATSDLPPFLFQRDRSEKGKKHVKARHSLDLPPAVAKRVPPVQPEAIPSPPPLQPQPARPPSNVSPTGIADRCEISVDREIRAVQVSLVRSPIATVPEPEVPASAQTPPRPEDGKTRCSRPSVRDSLDVLDACRRGDYLQASLLAGAAQLEVSSRGESVVLDPDFTAVSLAFEAVTDKRPLELPDWCLEPAAVTAAPPHTARFVFLAVLRSSFTFPYVCQMLEQSSKEFLDVFRYLPATQQWLQSAWEAVSTPGLWEQMVSPIDDPSVAWKQAWKKFQDLYDGSLQAALSSADHSHRQHRDMSGSQEMIWLRAMLRAGTPVGRMVREHGQQIREYLEKSHAELVNRWIEHTRKAGRVRLSDEQRIEVEDRAAEYLTLARAAFNATKEQLRQPHLPEGEKTGERLRKSMYESREQAVGAAEGEPWEPILQQIVRRIHS